MEEFVPVTIPIPQGVRKVTTCKVYYDATKQFWLKVGRVANSGTMVKYITKTGYTSSEHAIFDAPTFIRFMETHTTSSTFEKCSWPIVSNNTDTRNEREAPEVGEGQSRKKARMQPAYVAKKSIVIKRSEKKIMKEMKKMNQKLSKLVSLCSTK